MTPEEKFEEWRIARYGSETFTLFEIGNMETAYLQGDKNGYERGRKDMEEEMEEKLQKEYEKGMKDGLAH